MKIRKYIAAVLAAALLASCGGQRGPSPGDPARSVITHKVADGETWESIAGDYYNDRGRAVYLAVYNGFDGKRRPEPGTGIRIPLTGEDIEAIEEGKGAVRLYNSGLELAGDGDFAGAVEKFREALRLDPSLDDASFNLAVTYQRLGLHSNAVTVLGDLLVRSRSNPEYLFALGNSYFHLKEYGKAGRFFRNVLDIDREHLKALYSLAVVYEKTGDTEEAARTWQRYIDIDPDSEWGRKARSHLAALKRPDGGRN
jgi:tetratricopeptide (TPR) repeat protein